MSAPSNPEFEHYRQQLLQRRRYYPIYGLLLLITGGLGFLAIVPPYLYNPAELLTINQRWLIHMLLFLGFLACTAGGILLIVRSYRPPSPTQIQRFRRSERQRLFLQANGHTLPWWSRLLIRILITLVGLLFVVGGSAVIFFFGPNAWDGWIYLIVGSFLISLVSYFIPKEIRKLPASSAEQLAQNWISGEATAGDDLPSA